MNWKKEKENGHWEGIGCMIQIPEALCNNM
jgi:hypothetical protein